MFLYFVRNGQRKNNAIKIGIAADVKRRIEELQIGNPCQLNLIAAIPCGTRKQAEHIEGLFHRRFKSQNIRGEWFSGNIKIKKILDELEIEIAGMNI